MKDDKPKRPPFHVEFAEKIIERLKEGTAPWQKPWEDGGQIVAPHNPVSGTVYRGVNRVGLALSGYDDPRWMTYKQAQEAGYQVQAGSKSTPVVFYQWTREKDKMDENGNPVLGEDGKPEKVHVYLDRPIVRFAHVFNAEQIDGDLPPLSLTKNPHKWEPLEKAESILAASGSTIKHDQSNRAFYRPLMDEIHLPPKVNFDEPGKYYATALHELGHWTGHESRLNREGGPFGSEPYAKEELRAEIASWMLGQDIGVRHDPDQHVAYVASWIKALEEDPSEIMRACRDAEQIKEYVLVLERDKELGDERVKTPEVERPDTPEPIAAMGTPDGAQEQSAPSRPAPEKTWLSVPYREKEQAKSLGAKWDTTEKSWYAPKGADLAKLAAWLPEHARGKAPEPASPEPVAAMGVPEPARKTAAEKVWLVVPFREKEQAKRLGAKWDRSEKCWFAPEGADQGALSRWLPEPGKSPVRVPGLSPEAEFARMLDEAGFDMQGREPVMDGKIHRVPLLGKLANPGRADGAYCGYLDHLPAGWAQNHITGEVLHWSATGHVMTPEESAERRAAMEQQREEREQSMRESRNAVAKECRDLWDKLESASPDAHYLKEKGVPSFGLRQDQNGFLAVPLRNTADELRGFQSISPEGEKRFKVGMEKKGNFHTIAAEGKDFSQGEILICEGYATGASLHMATEKPVAVALDSGNLEPVAKALREKFPQAQITICADNDHALKRNGKPYNVGMEKAKAAALAVGGKVAAPVFNEEEKAKGLTDFNDLHKSRGIKEVQKQVGLSLLHDQGKTRELSL